MKRIQQYFQNRPVKLINDTKSIEWLVDNTYVSVFDPLTFEGYQRSIDETHCQKIIAYITQNALLPTAIICAIDGIYNVGENLRIVDGQHRVEAFRILRRENQRRYDEVKDIEIPVIILEQVDPKVEVETFITINKTSKKVDTSLAYILKNKINENKSDQELSIPKREYLSVELARKLNFSKNSIWNDSILFEGSVKNTTQLISLNAFVKSTRGLIGAFEKYQIIDIRWESVDEIDRLIDILYEIIEAVWFLVAQKWPELFSYDKQDRSIIQGAIGYSAINKFIGYKLNSLSKPMDIDELKLYLRKWINAIDINAKDWVPGGRFSIYSSEAGHTLVAKEIYQTVE